MEKLILVVFVIVITLGFSTVAFIAGLQWATRGLQPMVDILKALTKTQTADRASLVEEALSEFKEARAAYAKQYSVHSPNSVLSRCDLNEWTVRIQQRDRELRDREFKPDAQKIYNKMIAGGKPASELARLSEQLRPWMKNGRLRLSDLGHSHDDEARFLAECGINATPEPEPPASTGYQPLGATSY